MPNSKKNKAVTDKSHRSRGSGVMTEPSRGLLERFLEIKNWIGLGVAIVVAVTSSVGWVLTYFAKKEEVDILSCTMDVNVRIAKDASSIQSIREREIFLRRELKSINSTPGTGRGKKPVVDTGDDEYSTPEKLRAAITNAKDDLRVLSADSTFFLKSLADKECDSKEGRYRLRDKLRIDPQLRGG